MFKENFIIITDTSNKKNILKTLSQEKKLYNIKFYTFNDIKKQLYFDYNNETLEFIIKNYNVNLNIAKIYLDNLYFLKDLDYDKIKFLNKLKKELEKNNLLIYNRSFKNYLENKKIIVYGYNELMKEQKMIINGLDNIEIKKSDKKKYMPVVFEASNIEEEVEFVLNQISELITRNISVNKIKLIINDEYKNVLKRYFRLYNIPLNIEMNNLFFSTCLAQEFLNNYDQYSILENINRFENDYDNINDLINVINKSVLVKDKDIRKYFIINDLKNTKIKNNMYDNAVNIASIEDIFDDDEYVFLLGFNINYYPQVFKDEDYLNDRVKNILELDTSIDKNKYTKNNIKEKIQSIKNLVITYKLKNGSVVYYPSVIIKELGLEVRKVNFNRSISYSKMNSKIHYASLLDNLYKFNMVDDMLGVYRYNLDIPYMEYDNSFKGINNKRLKESMSYELTLSYTNMEMYNECAFKYYVSKILKINNFLETFKIIVGNIIHHILEMGLSKDINIDVEIINFIKEKDYELNKKEYFYLEKLSEELKSILKIIKEQEKHSKLNKYLFENDFYVYKDIDLVKVTFKGLIDKIVYNEINNDEVLAVIDYKTGDVNVTLDNLEYGLNMQIPIYLYLLKKSKRFKNAKVAGFYIQKVLDKVPMKNDKKSLDEIKQDSMRLAGFTSNNISTIELLDDNYLENKILKNLKFKKDGNLDSRSKVLSEIEMDQLTLKVEEEIDKCINNILDGEFSINPKIINDKNIACQYCEFKDICFKTKNDEVRLGGEEIEVDE